MDNNITGKFRRLHSNPAILGWISLGLLLWKILEGIHTLDWVVKNMSSVWNFLSTPWGMLALLVIGLSLVLYSVFRPKKTKITDTGSVTQEQLEFYKLQKENWKSNLDLRIIDVIPVVNGDIPKIIFKMGMINYLPFEIKLVKVVNSSGTVNAGELGSCALPIMPETINKKMNACFETHFTLEMQVGGTKVPDFLKPKLTEWGQLLQWTLEGEWYVEVDGREVEWETKSYKKLYNQVIERQYTVQRRGL